MVWCFFGVVSWWQIFVGIGVLGWVIVIVVMMNEVLVQRRENFWF